MWTIAGILTGHCRLNYHLGKLGISTDTAYKSYVKCVEISIHILGQCPAPVQNRPRHHPYGNVLLYKARSLDLGTGFGRIFDYKDLVQVKEQHYCIVVVSAETFDIVEKDTLHAVEAGFLKMTLCS